MTIINDYNANIGEMTERKICSPIPSKRIKHSHNNSFLKSNKIYKAMDNFNRKIVKGEYMDKLNENEFRINNKGILLPKINLKKNKNKLQLHFPIFDGNKKYLYRERKKKTVDYDSSKFNSNFL